MGVYVSNSLIVGASYRELKGFLYEEAGLSEGDNHYSVDMVEVMERHFSYASPYYDSGIENWFIGFEVVNHSKIGRELFDNLAELRDKFKELTGIEPTLRGGVHTW